MRFLNKIILLLILGVCSYANLFAASSIAGAPEKIDQQALPEITKNIEISPSAQDEEITQRLENILLATSWFQNVNVIVEDGVVFLRGQTNTAQHKAWAEDLANKTQDVVAVVNEIKITTSSAWYMHQLKVGIKEQWQSIVRGLPYLGFSILILLLAWIIARLIAAYFRYSLLKRHYHPLLSDVIARGVALLSFLVGLYIVLQILGLTTIAFTILGGTGVIGIILGIAFRDITENLLASILLSVQNPFHNEDLIEVDGVTGYVQSLNIRTTVLFTLEGNEVQIPNATVYKSNIYNFTTNAKRRESFIIGIGYNDSISDSQAVVLRVLQNHHAVLDEPEPWVLVEELTETSVNLHVFFWLDGSQYQWRKVKSSVIRLVKRALQEEGIIIMPGQILEVSLIDNDVVKQAAHQAKKKKIAKDTKESSQEATKAEGGLGSEAEEIIEQGRNIRDADKAQNLLIPAKNNK